MSSLDLMVASLLAACALVASLTAAQSDIPVPYSLQSILSKAGTGSYDFPTSFASGIIPKGFDRSRRPVLFHSALAAGAMGVEADIWLYNDTMFVGHEQSALARCRTFDSLYILPILRVLHMQKPNTTFVSGTTKNGPAVVKALAPLRNVPHHCQWHGKHTSQPRVGCLQPGLLLDAPIPTPNTTFSNITKDVSPIVSTDFPAQFGNMLSEYFNESHEGIKVRYWELPGCPLSNGNAVWSTLWDYGVDFLNVEILEAVANF
ncbi:hypothetical protein GQ53DRAFT_778077 [Thozetella sp. PMI_491]|nr:hypothetical protein GQ53DRAFT_778077 [Thozetella sp. PMI_491]